MPSPTMILALLLAIAVAGDAFLFRQNGELHDRLGAFETANKQVAAAAQQCSNSVGGLAAAGDQRHQELLANIKAIQPVLNKLQAGVTQTLNAKPANPADLCGSALILSQQEIAALKALAGGDDAKK